jgi:hypothetical protein
LTAATGESAWIGVSRPRARPYAAAPDASSDLHLHRGRQRPVRQLLPGRERRRRRRHRRRPARLRRAGFRARLDALHKPLLAVLVTHGHPDHFNGVIELVRGQGDVPIYATAEGKAVIDEVAEPKRAQWSPTYGDEWPAQTAYPNATVGDGETLTIGGLRVRAHELGPCESASEALYVVEGSGDDAPRRLHRRPLLQRPPQLQRRRLHRGVARRARSRARPAGRDRHALPRSRAPGRPEALDAQRRYQLMLREAVRNLADGEAALSDAAKEELTARMSAFLPDRALAWLVGLSADAVAAELAAEPRAVST